MNNYGNVLSLMPAVELLWQTQGRGPATVRLPFVSVVSEKMHKQICIEIELQVKMGPVKHK